MLADRSPSSIGAAPNWGARFSDAYPQYVAVSIFLLGLFGVLANSEECDHWLRKLVPALSTYTVVIFTARAYAHNLCDQLREPHSASSFKNGTKTWASFFNLPTLRRLPPPELWPAPARSPRFSGVLGVVVGELFRSDCFRGDPAVVSGRVRSSVEGAVRRGPLRGCAMLFSMRKC